MASVSMAESAVIRRTLSWFSNTSSARLSSCTVSRAICALPCLLIRRRATGPPIRPPKTRPKVAAAMPRPVAPTKPNFCSKVGPHAPAVPWPPVSVIEPAIRPSSGSCPKAEARPTPTAFCTRMNAPTTRVNTTSGTPPAFRREKSALKPMEVKKISMKAVCSDLSNWKLTP